MAEPKIELRKIRDFGENFSDTFEFIRQNFKPMVKGFFAIAGIFILAQAISNGIVEYQAIGELKNISNASNDGFNLIKRHLLDQYFSSAFVLYGIFTWLAYIAMQVCIGAYMKFYDLQDGVQPEIDDVWSIFKKYFLKVLLFSIPVSIITAIGFILCILPGIYLAVAFVPFPWILMIEDASLGDGLQRCIELIKKNFWISLALYVLTYLIYSFASGIIGLLVGGVSGLLSYLTTRDFRATLSMVTSVIRVFSFLFYLIFLVSAMLHYFNLVEQRDATGLLQRVDQIGEQPDIDPGIEEQY